MQKTQVDLAVSSGDLLLSEKQKKPIICLNNEINEAAQVAGYSFR